MSECVGLYEFVKVCRCLWRSVGCSWRFACERVELYVFLEVHEAHCVLR